MICRERFGIFSLLADLYRHAKLIDLGSHTRLFAIVLASHCVPAVALAQSQIGADIDGEAARDQSGFSVSLSIDGSRLAIGALRNDGNGEDSGHVRVFQWADTAWLQLGNDIDGEAAGDYFGYGVSLSADGGRLAIGATNNDGNGVGSGHVRVFQWSGSEWLQLGADIDGDMAHDRCGRSVSLSEDGNRLAVGASQESGNPGYVRAYQWSGSEWMQVGASIEGETAGDQFGYSVSLSADSNRLAIGADRNDGNGENSGQVRVYQWNGSSWQQLGADIDGEAAGDYFGYSVSLSAGGDRFASGAWGNSGGHVRVFDWNGTDWLQVGDNIDGKAELGQFGASVAFSAAGNRLAIGDTGNSDSGYHASGQVQVYQWSNGAWTQLGDNINGTAEYDFLGTGLALSADGNRLAAGAIEANPNGAKVGRVSVYDFSMFNVFQINPGLNDAWFNRATNGQGMLIAVFPDIKQLFLAWFTYDTERPPEDVTAMLGEPGHRWLTAQGPYDGDTAILTIYVTAGGVFDAANPKAVTDLDGDGTMTLEFAGCNAGLVNYSITSLGISGQIPIERIVLDNVALCESL